MGIRVKICGITCPHQGAAIARLGATALGFICAPRSPRYVSPAQIQAIVANLTCEDDQYPWLCDRIGVFVNASLETITQTVAIGQLNGVQLHGDESPEFCAALRQALPGVEVIKAFRVKSAAVLEQAWLYRGTIDTLLLDAYHPQFSGGTGQTLDWQALHDFRPDVPWLLAGGLTPNNVLEALQLISPTGIDLSSGVEHHPGDKNLSAVALLFERLQQRHVATAQPPMA